MISNSKEDNSFHEENIVKWTYEIFKGVKHLHDHKIIHRDIKPENILVKSTGEIKITDFGCSRFLSPEATHANTFAGTLHYMSPEA